MTYDLSIVVVNYNTKKLLVNCIRSLRRDSLKTRWEVIVVDNSSSDGSVVAIEKLQKKLPQLSLIKNSSNLGFARANNKGIKKAKGKFILLLNSDTEVKKGAIDKLVSFAEKSSEAGVVGAKLLNVDGSVQPSCFHFPTVKNAILQYWFGRDGLFDKYAPKGNKPQTVDALVGAAFLITPKALKRVGLLNPRYFMYFEDIDYCRKVWNKGLKVYYLPSAEVVHIHGASGAKIADTGTQWRRLIPSSKIYHGTIHHYSLNLVLWIGQKWQKVKTAILR